MDTRSPGFPHELLTQAWTSRLEYFRGYTMAHPRLIAVRNALLAAIHDREPNSLILVLGPSGVGKTTLRVKIEQLLVAEMLADVHSDPGRLPVVSVECIAPESGTFSWRDQFYRLLQRMEEPLIDCKLDPGTSVQIGKRALKLMPNAKAAGPEYRHALEQALRFRRPLAVLLDEAQHLASMGSGRRLSNQLDVIKSIANCTGTAHVLLGTYSLLAFRNLSAQLSRRSVDIHFPRYRSDDPEDLKMFRTVLRSFELHLPLSEPPELVREWEYLYERSIGCVGVLKEWLLRALAGVLRKDADVLALRDLESHALNVAQCDKMLAEALEGEMRLLESSGERARLRTRLGLSVQGVRHEDAIADQGVREAEIPLPRKQRRTPGQRRPKRDAIACPLGTYGTSPTV
jgi:energy-coupling factor transporter ATP-binding protein EcfA2